MLETAAAAMLPGLRTVADEVTVAILEQQPDLVARSDAQALAAVDRATLANVGAIVSTLAGGVAPDHLDVPDGALDLLDHLAVQEDALPAMLRAYRLGAAAFTQRWLAHLGGHVDDTARYARLAPASCEHIAVYVDRISEVIVQRWAAVTDAAARSGRRREAVLRALLDGGPGDAAELDHPLDGGQVVVVTTGGPGPATGPGGPARMSLSLPDDLTLAWTAAPHPVPRALIDRELASAPADGWTVVASAVPGPASLIDTARDALDGLRVLRRTRPGPAAAAHADLALLATLLADEPRARRLADAVLGPLADPGPRATVLRDTLRAYFDAGERKTGAAGLLRVHEKTVGHRLRQIEETLGHRVDERRADLVVALMIDEALGPRAAPDR